MEINRIAIRADGGSKIGIGHIMRTLVLAKELSKSHYVFYVCKANKSSLNKICNIEELKSFVNEDYINSAYEKGIEKILNEGFQVQLIKEANIIEDLKKVETDLLITDSYDVNEEYFNETKQIFRKTAYIDDVNLYSFNVDYLINQNANAEDFKYKTSQNTKLMLGVKYIMLRDEFRNVPKKVINKKVKDIMLTIGGADPYHITEQILSYVKELDYNFHVVVGPSFQVGEDLKSFENEKIKLYYNANMYELMDKCDMAVSACGSTVYELAACGVPTLGVIIADNQEGLAAKMNSLGLLTNLGWYNSLNKQLFQDKLTNIAEDYELRKEISRKCQQLIDGKGSERIAKII